MGVIFLYHDPHPITKLLPLLQVESSTSVDQKRPKKVIILWGYAAAELLPPVLPVDTVLLNSPISLKRCRSLQHRERILQLHGLLDADAMASQTSHDLFRYVVHIFHLQAIALYGSVRQPVYLHTESSISKDLYHEMKIDWADRIIRKVIRQSIKAVYALGLDYASVSIGVRPSGYIAIRKVNPEPQLNDVLAQRYASAINHFGEEWHLEQQRIPEVWIGADPEFILRDLNGQVVMADQYLPLKGEIGCDAILLPDRSKIYPIVELRPAPQRDPRRMTARLHRALLKASTLITDLHLEWLGGSMPVFGMPLGGHIHFSGLWLSSQLLRTLDTYLALPLVMLEDETSNHRRPMYGFLGDFRRKNHGGFEYRTLPSWLTSPKLTLAILTLSKLIAMHYQELHQRPLLRLKMETAYYEGNKEGLYDVCMKLWQDIEQLPSYADYERELVPLGQMIKNRIMWEEQRDFRPAWKIPPYTRKQNTLDKNHVIIQ